MAVRVTDVYRITTGDRRSTDELVEAGNYGYAHSCVTSENFPERPSAWRQVREIALLEFDRDVTAADVMAAAAHLGFERPIYEDASASGASTPRCNVIGRWCSFMILGLASSGGGTFSASGATPAAGSSDSKGSMTRGAASIALRSSQALQEAHRERSGPSISVL